MTRRRYISLKIGGAYELVEITKNNEPEQRGPRADSLLWNDRSYQDLGDPRFASRTQHREYMHSRGLTVTSDYKEEWKRAEATRVRFKQEGYDPTRKEDIARAISQLNSRRK